jgi:hypothetical protein
MPYWLYQMSEGIWITVDRYKKRVKEGKQYEWMRGKILTQNKIKPKKGDIIILFFAPKNNPKPGLYGWGVILNYDKYSKNITFRLWPPSDRMKLNPIWDNDVKKWTKDIRRKFFTATMWEITSDLLKPKALPKTLPKGLREKISRLNHKNL